MEKDFLFVEKFSQLEDPRSGNAKLHKLIDVIVLVICAVICGADDFVSIASYGKSKEVWLKQNFQNLRDEMVL
ncbi:MAG: transposase family protein [Nitrospirae bacterium]|nr:transposase family protein [Nitrospirota bacterium]